MLSLHLNYTNQLIPVWTSEFLQIVFTSFINRLLRLSAVHSSVHVDTGLNALSERILGHQHVVLLSFLGLLRPVQSFLPGLRRLGSSEPQLTHWRLRVWREKSLVLPTWNTTEGKYLVSFFLFFYLNIFDVELSSFWLIISSRLPEKTIADNCRDKAT